MADVFEAICSLFGGDTITDLEDKFDIDILDETSGEVSDELEVMIDEYVSNIVTSNDNENAVVVPHDVIVHDDHLQIEIKENYKERTY